MKRLTALFLALALCLSLCTVTAFAETPTYTVTVDSNNITNGTVTATLTNVASGTNVTLTVTPADGYKLKSLTCVPTSAVPAGFVDLGITAADGTPLYWAECNLGASQAKEYGYYYAWGGTTGYTHNGTNWVKAGTSVELSGGFSSANAPYYEGSAYTKYTGAANGILQPEDDAATTENSNWRIPTIAEFQALKEKCYWEWTDNYKDSNVKGVIVYRAEKEEDAGKYNGQEGYTTSSNTHIFLPAAGDGVNTSLSNVNNNALYWSSTLSSSNVINASCLFCTNSDQYIYDKGYARYYGFPIRPVTTSFYPGITPEKQTDGTYQFTMPGYAVTVTAVFEEIRDPAPDDDHDVDYEKLAKAGMVAAGVVTTVVVTKIVVDKLHEIKAAKDAAAEVTPEINVEEMPMVAMGSSGDAVTTLQTKLNELGYNCGEADGVFGQNTLNAVIAFQTAKGLTADGIVGAQTWEALL